MDDTIVEIKSRVIQLDGVRITVTDHSFEIYMRDEKNELWVQYAVQHLKEWCKLRKKKQKQLEEWMRPR